MTEPAEASARKGALAGLGTLGIIVTGCAAVLMERWDASEAVELIKRHGVTMSVGATPFLRELTDTVVSAGALLPTMRLFICGGAPVAPELVRRAAQAIPGCAIRSEEHTSELQSLMRISYAGFCLKKKKKKTKTD